jgi:hypothetical protein
LFGFDLHFETGSHYVAQADLKVLWSQGITFSVCQCWDYRHAPPLIGRDFLKLLTTIYNTFILGSMPWKHFFLILVLYVNTC